MNLRQLFDYNVIAGNSALDAMIEDTLSRYGSMGRQEMNEEQLELVSAAGSDAMLCFIDKKEQ